jgi:hypothetical protein
MIRTWSGHSHHIAFLKYSRQRPFLDSWFYGCAVVIQGQINVYKLGQINGGWTTASQYQQSSSPAIANGVTLIQNVTWLSHGCTGHTIIGCTEAETWTNMSWCWAHPAEDTWTQDLKHPPQKKLSQFMNWHAE